MVIVGNLFQAIATILNGLLRIYQLVIMISVLISWVSPDPFNPIVKFLRSATEPIFDWIRRRLPFAVIGMLDLSPLVALLAIQLLQMVVVRSLFDYAFRFR